MRTIATFYRFTPFVDPKPLGAQLQRLGREWGIKGTLLLAHEGINGTIAGTRPAVGALLAHIRGVPGCDGLEWTESTAEHCPFGRLKVKIKPEIVSLGQDTANPRIAVGEYVAPEQWNALLRAPDVVAIDTRNSYEVAIGSFAGAVNPQIARFRDFPRWWQANAPRFAGKRVAMFCTGGIRCEKSTSYALAQGAAEVYHLKGGILRYLQAIPADHSLWRGSCFTFDGRVSLDHGLRRGPHILCYGCRHPILPSDSLRPEYEPGVSCHHCLHKTGAAHKARRRERQQQMELARARC
ncbi:MAG: rhodanese-related sulfurtransferase [Rhodobacteraceae bacterium]|nr:rhodanese-related sulfurtransferase [Paracoccaceae bacterium]